VLGAAGLAGGVVAGLGLVEAGIRLGGHDLALYFKQGTMVTHYSFGSTIGHTNYLAAYLALVLAPLVALAAVADGGWRRGWLAASAAVIGLVLALARSIGALVGLSVGALVAAVLTFKAKPSRRAGLVLGLLLLIVTAGGATVAVRKLADSTNPIGVRVATLQIGLVAIAERPIAGFGADGYSRESNRLERQVFGRPLTEFRAPSEPLSAHNAYLDLAVERGLPALATFVGLLGAVLLAGFRAYRRADDRATKLLIGGLMAGLVAFMIQALTENLFAYSKVAAIFWILAAALVRARRAA
jgi:O-antigen ligase